MRALPAGKIPAEHMPDVEEVIALSTITGAALASGAIRNELESNALQVALEANGRWADEPTPADWENARITQSHSIMLAHAVLQRWVDPTEDLTRRLRDEHPDSFDANLAAAVIEVNSSASVNRHLNQHCGWLNVQRLTSKRNGYSGSCRLARRSATRRRTT